jgi:archaemetzincin
MRAHGERHAVARMAVVAVALAAAGCDSTAPAPRAAPPDQRQTVAAAGGPEDAPPARGFAVPDARTRVRAAGGLAGLSAELRTAFAPGPGFIPIAAPQPGDWLAEHDEAGQTYDQFVAARPNRPGAGRRTIYIVPLGDLGRAAPPLDLLADFTRAHFQLPVRVLPAIAVDDIGARTRRHDGRRQMLATGVLDYLRSILPADAYCLVGLTAVDLYPEPSWSFVFGMASFRERVGVYSIARYHPPAGGRDAASWVRSRALKVMAHEIGHMFGMEHCIHYECVMNGSNHLAETDRRPMNLCPVCLRKLFHAVGFAPGRRYRELARFFAGHGLETEAAWAAARADELARVSRRPAPP